VPRKCPERLTAVVARFLLRLATVAKRLRWLIVVDRGRPDIFQDFSRRFHGWARVLLDRRAPGPTVAPDYDGPERRRPPVRQPFLRENAYRLVYKIEGFELHERADPSSEAQARLEGGPLYRL
jgi:hypothetical protein